MGAPYVDEEVITISWKVPLPLLSLFFALGHEGNKCGTITLSRGKFRTGWIEIGRIGASCFRTFWKIRDYGAAGTGT